MPFWDLVRDFAAQGFGMRKTAQALGMSGRQFCRMCKEVPWASPFKRRNGHQKDWIARIEAEYGMPLEDLLRRDAAAARETKTSLAMQADEFGVTESRLRWACHLLGITWPRVFSERAHQSRRASGFQSPIVKPKQFATIDGVHAPLIEHAKRLGISIYTVRKRIRCHGMTNEQALLTPLQDGFAKTEKARKALALKRRARQLAQQKECFK